MVKRARRDPATTAVVRLVGVQVRYRGGPVVLTGLGLELGPGRPVVVFGANGSGKSTLLRVVAGCTSPSAGTVTGCPRAVGFVPDRFPSQLQMPARNYLRHMAALHRTDAARAAHRARALLDELGFSGGLSTPMSQLSKGNAQKIALAQALCSGARLLVLDEPWSGLDPAAAPTLAGLIVARADEGAAVLISDHAHAARGLPDRRLLRLDAGRLAAWDGNSATQPPPGETVRITLIHPHPARFAERLPHDRVVGTTGDLVTVEITPQRSDALLRTALESGASIHSVHRMVADPPAQDGTDLERAGRER